MNDHDQRRRWHGWLWLTAFDCWHLWLSGQIEHDLFSLCGFYMTFDCWHLWLSGQIEHDLFSLLWFLYEMDKYKPTYILTSQAMRVGLFLFSF